MIEHSIEDGYLVIRIPLKLDLDHKLDVKLANAIQKLTVRECQIFREVLNGACVKEMASKFMLSTSTVKVFHLQNIYKKLGVNGMNQLRKAYR